MSLEAGALSVEMRVIFSLMVTRKSLFEVLEFS
jgi:hypothetical protein